MEHILQFAVNIDDEAIVRRIEENAEKTITRDLRAKVGSLMFGVGYRGEELDNITGWTESMFKGYLDEHKEEIVHLAAKFLAERLAKSKAAKEMLNDVLENPGVS